MAPRKKVRRIPKPKRPGPRSSPDRPPKDTNVNIAVTEGQKARLYRASDLSGDSFASWARRVLMAAAERLGAK